MTYSLGEDVYSTVLVSGESERRRGHQPPSYEVRVIMNYRTRFVVGNGLLLVGLVLFVLGAAIVVLDYRLDVSVAVVGALALFFVGVGTAVKGRTEPPTD